MPRSDLTLVSLFVAAALSVAILLGAFVAALVISQRRHLAEERLHARRLLAAQEEERSRIARELHDDALQRIALLRHEVDLLAELGSEAAHRAAGVSGELEDLGAVLRTAAHQLHPSVVEKAGLVRALGDLAGEFGRTAGLEVRLALPPADQAIPMAAGVALYRIAQEALRNAVKHAGVDRAELSLAVEPATGELVLRVVDAGRGFDDGTSGPGHGLGLVAMRQRAEALGGRLTVRATPGGGTAVTAVVPRERSE
jgi:two-component system sensor histidine kinase UhpB